MKTSKTHPVLQPIYLVAILFFIFSVNIFGQKPTRVFELNEIEKSKANDEKFGKWLKKYKILKFNHLELEKFIGKKDIELFSLKLNNEKWDVVLMKNEIRSVELKKSQADTNCHTYYAKFLGKNNEENYGGIYLSEEYFAFMAFDRVTSKTRIIKQSSNNEFVSYDESDIIENNNDYCPIKTVSKQLNELGLSNTRINLASKKILRIAFLGDKNFANCKGGFNSQFSFDFNNISIKYLDTFCLKLINVYQGYDLNTNYAGDAYQVLSTFTTYVQNNLGGISRDHFQFIKGQASFIGPYPIFGLANVGSICTNDSYSWSAITLTANIGDAINECPPIGAVNSNHPRTIAHELGHALNAVHDDISPSDPCYNGTFMMKSTSAGSSGLPNFSSCSQTTIDNFLNGASCLQSFLPQIASTVDGNPNIPTPYFISSNFHTIYSNTPGSNTSYSYSIDFPSSSSIQLSSSGNFCNFNTNGFVGTFAIRITATNGCGTFSRSIVFVRTGSNLRLFPNEANETINLKLEKNNILINSIAFYNNFGKLLYTTKNEFTLNDDTITLNISKLEPGVNYLKVIFENGESKSIRFLVKR